MLCSETEFVEKITRNALTQYMQKNIDFYIFCLTRDCKGIIEISSNSNFCFCKLCRKSFCSKC